MPRYEYVVSSHLGIEHILPIRSTNSMDPVQGGAPVIR